MNKLQQKHKEVIAASNLYAEDRINAATEISLNFSKGFAEYVLIHQYEPLEMEELLEKYLETL